MLPFGLIVLAVLVAPAVGGAGRAPSTTRLHVQDTRIVRRARAAVLQLYSLDARLATTHARLGSLDAQERSLRAERAELATALAVAERGTRIERRRLAARLRLLYEQGDVEPLEIVFGARSLDEALSQLDGLGRVTNQAQDELRELRAARSRLARVSTALARRAQKLAEARRAAATTQAALERARAQRSTYIADLARRRRLTEQQIAIVAARARAAQARSASLAPALAADTTAAAGASRTVAAPAGARTLTVVATGYALTGPTSTGLPAGWGVAAVDPALISLGTHMTIPGYGEAVAADTGGSVVGPTIDLWFPSLAQANAWGRRSVAIVLH
jgi:3D (Asp-Asp-Asp) domain-containing protein